MIQFNWKFFAAGLALLAMLGFIALYVKDPLVRPFLGDSLAVIWLYTELRAFLKLEAITLASLSLALACAIEFAQYANLLSLLGLQHIPSLRIILGSTFDPLDLAAYGLGWALIIAVHTLKRRSSSTAEQN